MKRKRENQKRIDSLEMRDKVKTAVGTLKPHLITPLLLDTPRKAEKRMFETDVCDPQLVKLLMREQREELSKPTGYWFCSRFKLKRFYKTSGRE